MGVPDEVKLNNQLPRLPLWGVHRHGVTAADSAAPDAPGAGVNTKGFNSIWVDIHFKNVGTKTATIRPMFWNPGMNPDSPADGDFAGGFFEQDVIPDIVVDAGDTGHKAIKLDTYERIVWLKVQALGAGARVHVLVAGAVIIHER